jgi:hypothetical protein
MSLHFLLDLTAYMADLKRNEMHHIMKWSGKQVQRNTDRDVMLNMQGLKIHSGGTISEDSIDQAERSIHNKAEEIYQANKGEVRIDPRNFLTLIDLKRDFKIAATTAKADPPSEARLLKLITTLHTIACEVHRLPKDPEDMTHLEYQAYEARMAIEKQNQGREAIARSNTGKFTAGHSSSVNLSTTQSSPMVHVIDFDAVMAPVWSILDDDDPAEQISQQGADVITLLEDDPHPATTTTSSSKRQASTTLTVDSAAASSSNVKRPRASKHGGSNSSALQGIPQPFHPSGSKFSSSAMIMDNINNLVNKISSTGVIAPTASTVQRTMQHTETFEDQIMEDIRMVEELIQVEGQLISLGKTITPMFPDGIVPNIALLPSSEVLHRSLAVRKSELKKFLA